ncbi:hypothetical protein [Aureibacter tunicatorum]|uniref:Uncharacterized protein n=1 Tax=Aureibacter tunicatorum TaxID=866807 RepID=A0AAE3XLQ7_9BACT|nr:hypothetical protein [Aureibacter tunicatorum]MDR6238893.1 hypothetical protein [Aureibacter tunicatorum]BDD05180.1 hypothetical protein AUTU_26630 [Aureibacter tunicatorum]
MTIHNKKLAIISIMFIISLLIACNKRGNHNNNTVQNSNNITTQTPKALEENDGFEVSDLKIGRGRFGRKSNNIVDELYDEALENNPTLQALEKQIAMLQKQKTDSLSHYRYYTQTNNNYWSNTSWYLSKIQDSTLELSTKKIIDQHRKKYFEDVSELEKIEEAIQKEQQHLKDLQIIMKLSVTQQMIKAYQKNEKPKIEQMQKILNEYQELNEKAEKYIDELKN